MQACLLQHGIFVFDLNFNRVASTSYHDARQRRKLPALPVEGTGKPSTLNVLFCGDLAGERDSRPGAYYATRPPKIRQSTSWRITAPLRGIKRLLQRATG